MSDERLKTIALKRQSQPIAELERKWNKAKGRHSKRYWAQECLDLGIARGLEIAAYFNTGAN